ncbi:MAG: nicotinate phosphoribosyltransferase [Deltaproteobacteria bacterium]|nr:nicotinate phosphoribosyltransferase [Deltaproteobacteria bacterium]
MTTHALHTDLYQLTMLASYFHQRQHEEHAVCEMFVRRLPKNRRFLVVAGLQRALDYLRELRFTDAQVEALREVPHLKKAMTPDFIEYLRAFRFTGDVWAMPEGTIAFENEPLVRVAAPLGEAQLIETYLLSTINHATMIASKAARVVLALGHRPALEFGTRRTHPEAAVDVARAAYLAGFEASSNVEAFDRFDVPARGTMAHMYIMACNSEREAFQHYGSLFPHSTYLVDTYDTVLGVKTALDAMGAGVSAVRLDSGDLASLSREVRALLKERGRDDVKIVISSDLDEYEIVKLTNDGDFDVAGVGTRVATSDDAPALGGVYKLVQIGDRPVAKLSAEKVTYPGAHQVYRHEKDGRLAFDTLGLVDEASYEVLEATPLLVPAMRAGKPVFDDDLPRARARCRSQLAKLPDTLRVIERSDEHEHFFEVRPSEQLKRLLESIKAARREAA